MNSVSGVLRDTSSDPSIYIFEFDNRENVGLQRVRHDRYSRYDGALYKTWIVGDAPIVQSAEEITAEEVPSKVPEHDFYQSEPPREVTDEQVEAIKSFLSG